MPTLGSQLAISGKITINKMVVSRTIQKGIEPLKISPGVKSFSSVTAAFTAVKAAVTDEKDLTPGEIFSGSIPFWIVLLTTILLIVIFPEIANWLPNVGNELAR